MNKVLQDQIKWRALQIRETTKLASKYAGTKNYEDAARWYRAAAFHQSVKTALEAVRDNQ